jgi:hypothetical protein
MDAVIMSKYWSAESKRFELDTVSLGRDWGFARDANPIPVSPDLVPAVAQSLPSPSAYDYGFILNHSTTGPRRAAEAMAAGAGKKRVESLLLSPIELDIEREHSLPSSGAPDADGRGHTLALDPEVNSLFFEFVAHNSAFYAMLLNKGGNNGDGRYPDGWGPNPEAVAQIIVHRFANQSFALSPDKFSSPSQACSASLQRLLVYALTNASPDSIRQTFVVIEALVLAPDFDFVRKKRMDGIVRALITCGESSANRNRPSLALECLNELSRLAVLGGGFVQGILSCDNRTVEAKELPRGAAYANHRFEFTIFNILADIESDARARVPAWQLAAVDPALVTDADLKASVTPGAIVNGKSITSGDVADIPYRRYLTSLVAGSVTRLSLRDEHAAVTAGGISPSLRATIAVRRFRRAYEAAGVPFFTDDQMRALRTQFLEVQSRIAEEKALAAANAGSSAAAANVGGGGGGGEGKVGGGHGSRSSKSTVITSADVEDMDED